MKVWIGSNILFILLVIIWSFINQEFLSPIINIGKVLALVALLLFLININMYFIFLIIRKSNNKSLKKKLALFSRKMMKAHVPIAITAVGFVSIHGILMMVFHPIDVFSLKKMSGLAAVGILSVHLYSGWLRRKKASGFRRKFHLSMAFVFMCFFLVHIFI